MSPKVKIKVIPMTKAMVPLMMIDQMMALGKVSDAS